MLPFDEEVAKEFLNVIYCLSTYLTRRPVNDCRKSKVFQAAVQTKLRHPSQIFIEGQAWSFGALGDFRYCSLISFLLSRETTHVEKLDLI